MTDSTAARHAHLRNAYPETWAKLDGGHNVDQADTTQKVTDNHNIREVKTYDHVHTGTGMGTSEDLKANIYGFSDEVRLNSFGGKDKAVTEIHRTMARDTHSR